MNMIYKYPLNIEDVQHLHIHAGATLLCVQIQGNKPCLWAIVDTTLPKERRTIEIIGTGNPIEERARLYIGTCQVGPSVWHIFERL